MIYFDHAASSPLKEEVLQAMMNAFRDDFANPSAKHTLGRGVQEKIEDCRNRIKRTLNLDSSWQIIFTSSATESNNLIFNKWRDEKQLKVMYSNADHPSVSVPLGNIRDQFFETPFYNNGLIDLDRFSQGIQNEPDLLVISSINNHSGVKQDLKKICEVLKKENFKGHFHVDSSQEAGKFPLDLNNSAINSVTLTCHKMGGPKGIGVLLFRNQKAIKPFLEGGGHEEGMRASTMNFPLILGFTKALEISQASLESSLKKVSGLRDRLYSELKKLDFEVLFPFHQSNSNPYISTIIIPGIPSDMIIRCLESKNIFISSSSACSRKNNESKSVFEALQIDPGYFKNVLRISLAHSNTEDEVKEFIEILSQEVSGLRELLS